MEAEEQPSGTGSECKQRTAESWWSWLVLLCSFLSHVLILGCLFSFGVFYPALLAEFKQDKAQTALVHSFCFVIGGVLGPLTGRLVDQFGCRAVTVSSLLTCALSFLTTSFSPNLFVMFATYSALYGFGLSSIYTSTIVAVKSQFNEKLPVALGLLSAGNGAGILAMSPVIQLLLDNFGLRDTYRILAGLMGLWSSLGFGVNTRKSSENNRRQRVKDNEDEDISEASLSRCQYVLKTVFISPEFTIYTLSVAAVDTVGLVTCFVHMAKYAEGLGISADNASQLYLVGGLTSMIARALSGYILKVEWITSRYFYLTAALIGGITTLLLPLATRHVFLMVVCSILGWVQGTVVSVSYVIILRITSKHVPKTRQGQALGIHLLVIFLFGAAGPPIAGLIADTTGSYPNAFYLAGAIELLGAALVCLTFYLGLGTRSDTKRVASNC